MQIQSMTLTLTNPKMDIDMEFNQILILVGQNGTGKTLVMKLSWALTTAASVAFAVPTQKLETVLQTILDSTFDAQDFDGFMSITYTEGSVLSATLIKGQVVSAEVIFSPKAKQFPPPIFMSSTMRTFDQIKNFLKTKKLVPDISQLYKLYDIVYVELLSAKLSGGWPIPPALESRLPDYNLDKYDMKTFYIDDESVWFENSEGSRTDLTTLSAGEQSILNMFIGNFINNV